MTLKNQQGSIMATFVVVIGAAALMTIASTVLISSYYLKANREDLNAQASFSAYESCLGLFNNSINQTNQISGCGYGQCLNFNTGLGCQACGTADAKLTVGDACYCQLKYFSNDPTSVDFKASGLCDNTEFSNNVTLVYCEPDCAGKCGGPDSCGGICPNTCLSLTSVCRSDDNETCCDPNNPECF
ncbi:MAG: hypothetical protein V1765_02115 [bacterium]